MTESYALEPTEATVPEGSAAPPAVQDDRPCLLEAGETATVRRVVLRHEETTVGPALFRWHRDGKLVRATIENLARSDRVTLDGKPLERQTELAEGMTVTLAGRSFRFFLNGDIHHLLHDERYAEAARDAVSGCLNREALLDRLSEVYADARETITPLSLVTFDLAEHTAIHDNLSRADRDKAYGKMIDVVSQRLRSRDLLFRAREHVFVLVLPKTRGDTLEDPRRHPRRPLHQNPRPGRVIATGRGRRARDRHRAGARDDRAAAPGGPGPHPPAGGGGSRPRDARERRELTTGGAHSRPRLSGSLVRR
jgi:GGDEF domain-containing protein